MQFTLEQYATCGREAARAAIAKDPTTAALNLQWAIHALKTEHEPDRIFARAAYDEAYQRAIHLHNEFSQARKLRDRRSA